MPTIPTNLDLPIEIATRIQAGELTRIGSVVRNASNGRIVAHLNEVAPATSRLKPLIRPISKLTSTPGGMVVLGAATLMSAVGVVKAGSKAYKSHQANREARSFVAMKAGEALDSFEKYLLAARDGEVSMTHIDRVLSSFEVISDLSVEDLNEIILESAEAIEEYTSSYARSQGIDWAPRQDESLSAMDRITDALQMQREILQSLSDTDAPKELTASTE